MMPLIAGGLGAPVQGQECGEGGCFRGSKKEASDVSAESRRNGSLAMDKRNVFIRVRHQIVRSTVVQMQTESKAEFVPLKEAETELNDYQEPSRGWT